MRRVAVFVLGIVIFTASHAADPLPPRSAADILQLLSEQKPDPAKVEALKRVTAQQPPQTTDTTDLRNFYTTRATAAGELGLLQQQLEDLRNAQKYTPPGQERYVLNMQLIDAERQAGDFAAAVKLADEAPGNAVLPGARIGAWAQIAVFRASTGDRAGARQAFERSLEAFQQAQSGRFYPYQADNYKRVVEGTRATMLRSEGKYAEAEAAFRQAMVYGERYIANYDNVVKAVPSTLPHISERHRQMIRLEALALAGTQVQQGKFAEAEISARNAVKRALLNFGKYSPDAGTAVGSLARIIFEQGRFQDAAALYGATVEIYEKIGAAPYAATLVNALKGLGDTLVQEGKYAEADAVYQRARKGLEQSPENQAFLGAGTVEWVFALERLGRAEQAVRLASAIYERRRKVYGDGFYGTHEAHGFYALALASAGRDDEALKEFRLAVPQLVLAASSGDEGGGLAKALRMRRILEAYLGLLGRYAEKGTTLAGFDPLAEAFLIADVARGSAVQRALTAASARSSIRDPELAKLAREEQDAEQRIRSLSAVLVDLLSRPAEKSLPAVIAQMRKDVDALRARRTELKREIATRFPEYANLVDPKPVSLDAARQSLHSGEALIALYGTEDQTFVWVLPKEGAARFRAARLGAAERGALVGKLRQALDVGNTTLVGFPVFDVAAANKLYAELLAPLEPAWGTAKSLLVVPHGPLAEIPFALLVTQPAERGADGLRFDSYRTLPWLVRRAAITQLPSVNTLASLRSVKRTREPAKAFAGFGDPLFSTAQAGNTTLASAGSLGVRSVKLRSAPFREDSAQRLSSQISQLAPLPDTADEVQSIAKVLGAMDEVFLEARATEQNVKRTDLSDRRVVMFATHGLIPGDLDGLTQPALALSNPQVTGEADADGLLTMDEIFGLKLNADWVVLSACNTASGSGEGSEAVSGLGRAFFYAGARALLVSNWPVETVSAKLLTTELFRRQAADGKLARAEALRQAMLRVMDEESAKGDDGKPLYSYAHPMFWAPFSLVGDGN